MIYYGHITTSDDSQLIAAASIAGRFADNITSSALQQTANILLRYLVYFGHR